MKKKRKKGWIFKLGDKCDKDEIINMTLAWDKEKSLSPRQESNPWPSEQRAGALSTELRPFNWVHVWQAPAYC